MNRVIKLRVWDSETKSMGRVNSINFFNNSAVCFFPSWLDNNLGDYLHIENIFENDRFFTSEFTGLLDKNGEEIWEDDVLDLDGEIASVSWLNDGFVLIGENYLASHLYPQTRNGVWGEVIGNIYENPELIG